MRNQLQNSIFSDIICALYATCHIISLKCSNIQNQVVTCDKYRTASMLEILHSVLEFSREICASSFNGEKVMDAFNVILYGGKTVSEEPR